MYFKIEEIQGLIYDIRLATFSLNPALLDTLSCQFSVYAVSSTVEVERSSQSDRRYPLKFYSEAQVCLSPRSPKSPQSPPAESAPEPLYTAR